MKKRVLIIVDPQYDFIEGGSLAVDGGREALNRLVEYIKTHYGEYDYIIITADWHPITHCSFKENGGIWPVHCVQHSHGAAIYQPILDVLNELKVDYTVLTKGCNEDHEEYSIFKNDLSATYLKTLNNHNDIEVVDIGGLAFDICVANTLKDGLHYFPNSKFRVFKEFCASIDEKNSEDFTNFLNNCKRTELI